MRLFLLVLLLSGCGYTFSKGGTILPPEVRKIAIPLVDNQTVESELGRLLTDALREEFERYGAVQVAEEASEADAILSVVIEDVKRETATVTSGSQSDLQLDAFVTLSAKLEKVNGDLLWSRNSFVISRPVGTTAGSVVTTSPFFQRGSFGATSLVGQSSREIARGQEQSVFEEIASEAAREIYDEAVAEDF
jgi:outer membrane lipopolysaccharide assembly protein LptE/RlpB